MTRVKHVEKYIDDLQWVVYYLENPANPVDDREPKITLINELIKFFKQELKRVKLEEAETCIQKKK